MLTCYLVSVDRVDEPARPMCWVSGAETEGAAVARVVDGLGPSLVPGQRARVCGSLLRDAALGLGIPIERNGHVACACEHIG
jgi:hypothetical protein